MDYIEPACCFDSSRYTGTADTAPTEKSMNVPEVIRELEAFFERGQEREAGAFLEKKCAGAAGIGDWRAELSLLSELMGYYRRSMERAKALEAINAGMRIIEEHHMGRTVSGATVLLNAATTLKCFGRAEESLPVFEHVSRVFSDNLDPADYRFAGLFNNMALSFADLGKYQEAEKYYLAAMKIIKKSGENRNEMAVSLCNLAELYEKIEPEDGRIEKCMEGAWEYLNDPRNPRDGYHAFNASKCLPTFEHFGYFLYAMELKERVRAIYEGN